MESSAIFGIQTSRFIIWPKEVGSVGDWAGLGMGSFQEVRYAAGYDKPRFHGYADTSAKKIHGELTLVPIYKRVGCLEAMGVAFAGIYVTPFHLYMKVVLAALNLVVQAVRFVFFLLKAPYDIFKSQFDGARLKLAGIMFFKSLWEIIKAPFFAVVDLLAHVYTIVGTVFFISPMYGRKFHYMLMCAWNDGLPPQRMKQEEGQKRASYMFSCTAPFAWGELKEGQIVSIRHFNDPAKVYGINDSNPASCSAFCSTVPC